MRCLAQSRNAANIPHTEVQLADALNRIAFPEAAPGDALRPQREQADPILLSAVHLTGGHSAPTHARVDARG